VNKWINVIAIIPTSMPLLPQFSVPGAWLQVISKLESNEVAFVLSGDELCSPPKFKKET
jgi:hypothetical protein